MLKLVATHEEVQDYDLFKIGDIDRYSSRTYYRLLNSYLEDKIDSTEPNDNFDVISDSLIADLKKQMSSNYVKVEKLFLTLITLNVENECSPFNHKILVENYYAADERVVEVGSPWLFPASPRRVDKILSYYLHRAVLNCNKTYIQRFKNLYPTMDAQLVERVEFFAEKAIKLYTSDEYQQVAPAGQRKTFSDRLFSIIKRRSYASFDLTLDPTYVLEAMRTLVKGDLLEKFVNKQPSSELHGEFAVNRKEFTQLFQEYIAYPCRYYLNQLDSIFDPATFDSIFHSEVAENEEVYYRAWVTYLLCAASNWDVKLEKTISYLNNE